MKVKKGEVEKWEHIYNHKIGNQISFIQQNPIGFRRNRLLFSNWNYIQLQTNRIIYESLLKAPTQIFFRNK